MQTSRRAALALAAASLFTAVAAHAQAWPARPVRMVVPFPAGGGTDVIARELTNKLTSYGYTFVVENRPGSGGNLGVEAASNATPDGYTLVLGQTSNLAINPTLYSKLPYDPIKDLTPVGLVASAPLVIVTSSTAPYKTLADVVKAAKEKPGSINYASSGNGTASHLAMESFQKAAGIKLTHIPYKGAAQGATDVISGQVQLYVSTVPTLQAYMRSGKMHPLAITSLQRTPELPQLPTVAESGYKGFESSSWFGVLGPAGMPKDVVAKLNADIDKALKDPALKQKLSGQGANVMSSTPEAFAQLIRDDIPRWGKLVKDSGAKID